MKSHMLRLITPLMVLILILSACTSPAATTQPAAATQPATANTATQPAPTAPSATAPAATESAGQATPTTGAQPEAEQGQYEIVAEQSEARYRIREQLANLDLPNDAIGKTKEVSGSVLVNADGSIASADSKITVNLASIASDRSSRDNYVRRNILKTDQYPTATFVVTQVSGLTFPLPASGSVTFQVTGELTLLEVTKSVTWDATGVINGDEASGTAVTSFTFADFNLPKPSVPVVLSVNDEIKLEVDLTVRKVAGGQGSTGDTGAVAAGNTAGGGIPATGSGATDSGSGATDSGGGATDSGDGAALQCSSPVSLTPAMTEGPYYSANPPQTANLLQAGMGGTQLTLSGYVVDAGCQPVANARVDFWQADSQGVYDNSGYTLRGYQLTDASGAFRLVTVIPGLYPGRTEHIHVKVQAPGGPELTTQLFFPDVAQNQGDRIFDQALLVQNFADSDGGKTANFTFVVATK